MKITYVLVAVTTLLGAANAVAFANAAPAPQPEVIDIADMKLRVRGSSPRKWKPFWYDDMHTGKDKKDQNLN